MREFENFASKEQNEYVKNKLKGFSIDEVDRIRTVALEKYVGKALEYLFYCSDFSNHFYLPNPDIIYNVIFGPTLKSL